MNRNLIFDIGMHDGIDTEFYLQKGFYVLGIEANDSLCDKVNINLCKYIENSRLVVLKKALWWKDDVSLNFYINDERSIWSSLHQSLAKKSELGDFNIRIELVSTITLETLVNKYGLPYYIKCDIEGSDEIFARQLCNISQKPAFVSIEANDLQILSYLRSADYDRFQIVNQHFNTTRKVPKSSREGDEIDWKFSYDCSGLFGLDLEYNRWHSFEQTCRTFSKFLDLREIDNELASGWTDIHATTSRHLANHKPI